MSSTLSMVQGIVWFVIHSVNLCALRLADSRPTLHIISVTYILILFQLLSAVRSYNHVSIIAVRLVGISFVIANHDTPSIVKCT